MVPANGEVHRPVERVQRRSGGGIRARPTRSRRSEPPWVGRGRTRRSRAGETSIRNCVPDWYRRGSFTRPPAAHPESARRARPRHPHQRRAANLLAAVRSVSVVTRTGVGVLMVSRPALPLRSPPSMWTPGIAVERGGRAHRGLGLGRLDEVGVERPVEAWRGDQACHRASWKRATQAEAVKLVARRYVKTSCASSCSASPGSAHRRGRKTGADVELRASWSSLVVRRNREPSRHRVEIGAEQGAASTGETEVLGKHAPGIWSLWDSAALAVAPARRRDLGQRDAQAVRRLEPRSRRSDLRMHWESMPGDLDPAHAAACIAHTGSGPRRGWLAAW